ncbi:MAG TPA: LacI family DNA-binding transcriptional regulator [Victivallales bacterium]|nr:LacI family DNA-binding transcriptional regulator [Victivallales bacterium]
MNIKDIARLSGVSITTVSFILNGKHHKVSEKTKNKVLKVIKECGYEARGAARDLKRKNSRTIGVFFDFISGPYISLISGMQQVIRSKSYDFFIADNYNSSSRGALSRFLLEKRVDGAAIFSIDTEDEKIDELSALNMPIVMLDREVYRKNICSILIDNKPGMIEAIEFLKENGLRKVSFLSGKKKHYDNIERLSAFRYSINKYDMIFNEKWLFEGNFHEESGYSAALKLFEMKDRPDAVICSNDQMAVGLMQWLKDSGLKIPEDISIIGFDDIPFAKYTSPRLTTVKNQSYSMGKLVADTIFRGIDGENIEGIIKLPSRLIIRESARFQKKC